MSGHVLYAVMCGSPVTQDASKLVSLAQARGWEVCVVATPDALKWLDIPGLVAQTGHPVRHRYKYPGDPDILPQAEAMIVAPATVNTINKWAAGIADTLALGLIVEGLGKGLPIAAVPFTNAVMARHPAFVENIGKLRKWGVTVLWGDGEIPAFQPGTGESILDGFPWDRALKAVNDAYHG